MKKITTAEFYSLILGLSLGLGLSTSSMAQTMDLDDGAIDLDAMELEAGADTEESDSFILVDDEPGGGEMDLDGDAGDTLVLEEDVIELDDSADETMEFVDDDERVLEDVEPAGDTLEVDADTLSIDLTPEQADTGEAVAGAAGAEEGDLMVLDDGEAVDSIDVGATEGVDEIADMDAGISDIMADSVDVTDTDTGGEAGDMMLLDEGDAEIVGGPPGAEDEMMDLDADMAGMMAGSVDESGADVAADDAVMVMDEGEVLGAEASGEMASLDADMDAMMGGADTGAADAREGIEAGSLVMDEEVLDPGATGTDGLAMADVAEVDDQDDVFSIYAVLKNESAVFVRSGTVTGAEKSTLGGGSHNAGKLFKSEFSLNVYANAQITPDALVHAQLNLAYDPKAKPDWYRKPQAYTQFEVLRELYLDTSLPLIDDDGVSMRFGKQQVVWGTADGIKLLDIINPTDYREMVQNTFEDSRIPVWMLNLERNIGDNGNIQLIAAQNRRNRIPGLDQDGDSGQPFIMKGVDSITGSVNGFLNIAPAMGKVADAFNRFSALSGSPVGLTPLSFVTVNDFATNNPTAQRVFGSACSATFNPATPTSAACLNDITQRPDQTQANGAVLPGGDNQFVTNLIDATTQGEWDTNNPNSAFEYMGNATFATFNTFVSAKSRYRREDPDELSPNLGGRWKSSFGSNFNYSLNYFYSYDSNPSVSMSWENDSGETLKVKKVRAQDYVNAGILAGVPRGSENLETVILKDSAGRSYGPFDGDPTSRGFGGPGAGTPTLVFTEERNRIHNLGASFDYAMDTASLGAFVLRGEFLYQRNVRVPMVNRSELSIGNITEGLFPDEVNYFKYVLGAETILWTNLTVSAQFIQFVNLNFKGGSDVYHAHQAVVSLTNNLKKGYKYTNFGSLFLSKPFGAQQDGRVNNIIIAERGGGYWNRLDLEYRFSDSLIGSAEWNMYFGDEDTMFGQFKDSSNFQLGIKYIFE